MAARAAQGANPWDEACAVTVLAGGFAAMTAMRQTFEQVITDALASAAPAGDRGHVYVCGWRLNPLRDLSTNVESWPLVFTDAPTAQAALDGSAIGMLFRLMQAGVRVRVLVWYPTLIQTPGAGAAHVEDHLFLAQLVHAESQRLDTAFNLNDPIGIVGLDARTAEGSIAGTHHQKMVVVRGPNGNDVAFCGGVDMAYTRRDAPQGDASGHATVPGTGFGKGDWQTGDALRTLTLADPLPAGVIGYDSMHGIERPTHRQASDLPTEVYGVTKQIWHDQHLVLRGPIVRTLEDQFAERWSDSARFYDLSNPARAFGGQVVFSSAKAIVAGDVVALPLSQPATPAPAGSASAVQMWRTIPWRNARTRPPFRRAEFTAMAGISHATTQAKNLIWFFDQYFWSVPYARQLNAVLKRPDRADLRVILILPPFADGNEAWIHAARKRALDALTDGVRNKVGVYNLWHPVDGRGIYCHAKVEMYDGGLLVCGSVNLNRRSFLCDSELACAVADETVVAQHQQELWTMLFEGVAAPAGTWPAIDLEADQQGPAFFAAFDAAARSTGAFLVPDPWESATPALPSPKNNVPFPRSDPNLAGWFIAHLVDPTSLDPRPLERTVYSRDPAGALHSRPAQLDDVVKRAERVVVRGGKEKMPNRKQASDLRLPLTEPADGVEFAL